MRVALPVDVDGVGTIGDGFVSAIVYNNLCRVVYIDKPTTDESG